MTRSDVTAAARAPIHAVIAEHGALPVLIAALKALFARPTFVRPTFARPAKTAKPIRADLSRLDDWLRRDMGLPPAELRARFPYRSP